MPQRFSVVVRGFRGTDGEGRRRPKMEIAARAEMLLLKSSSSEDARSRDSAQKNTSDTTTPRRSFLTTNTPREEGFIIIKVDGLIICPIPFFCGVADKFELASPPFIQSKLHILMVC